MPQNKCLHPTLGCCYTAAWVRLSCFELGTTAVDFLKDVRPWGDGGRETDDENHHEKKATTCEEEGSWIAMATMKLVSTSRSGLDQNSPSHDPGPPGRPHKRGLSHGRGLGRAQHPHVQGFGAPGLASLQAQTTTQGHNLSTVRIPKSILNTALYYLKCCWKLLYLGALTSPSSTYIRSCIS